MSTGDSMDYSTVMTYDILDQANASQRYSFELADSRVSGAKRSTGRRSLRYILQFRHFTDLSGYIPKDSLFSKLVKACYFLFQFLFVSKAASRIVRQIL